MTIDDALKARWTLLEGEDVVGQFVRGNAIPDYFIAHPELGSPITGESDTDDGGRVQAFTNGVVVWHADRGVEVVTS
jgi:hypothetical protein